MEEKYYVEYSVIQKCLHVDTMELIQEANRSLCERKISNGYVIIAGPFTFEKAMDYKPKWHKGKQ